MVNNIARYGLTLKQVCLLIIQYRTAVISIVSTGLASQLLTLSLYLSAAIHLIIAVTQLQLLYV